MVPHANAISPLDRDTMTVGPETSSNTLISLENGSAADDETKIFSCSQSDGFRTQRLKVTDLSGLIIITSQTSSDGVME